MKEVIWKTVLWLMSIYLFGKTGHYMVELGAHPLLAATFIMLAMLIMYFSLFYDNKEEERK